MTMLVLTPECDKMIKVAPESQKIGNFLDWLSEQGLTICENVGGGRYDEYVPHYVSAEKLLARYFEIDLNKVEAEREAILEEFRNRVG